MPSGFVYILASRRNGTLYIGVTSDLLGRMEQHREGIGSAFVKKYGVCRLVHFEEYPLYTDAMRRETSHRRWKRRGSSP
jgi:putative endonuclease